MKLQDKPRVLLMSPLPPPVGGIASWTINILSYLSNHNITNVTHLNTAIRFRRITSNNTLLRLISGLLNFNIVFFKLLLSLLRSKPDVIHLTSSASLGLFADSIYVTFARFFQIPIITHWRFGRIPVLANQHNWEWKLLSFVIKRSNSAIVIDGNSYNTLLEKGFTNVVNIPNPISPFVEQKVNSHPKEQIKRKAGSIIFVGHVIKEKGIFELVEACSTNPLINELIIIGPYEEGTKISLCDLANARDSGLWLKIIGPADNNQVLEQMQKSTILALPSYSEGFPNVVIEAMAMGCAIIATEVGAIPEIIDAMSETPCGICVPVQNIESLKKAIAFLIENPEKAEVIGKQGIDRVLNNYIPAKIFSQYQNIWKQISTKKTPTNI